MINYITLLLGKMSSVLPYGLIALVTSYMICDGEVYGVIIMSECFIPKVSKNTSPLF